MLVVVLGLILLNGVFALSELAVVSARPRRLQIMAEAGRSGARRALALAENPGRLLSTVQIGITLVGILAGAVSGDALGGQLAGALQAAGLSPGVAGPLGFGLVIAALTYLSIVIGELVPKRFALRDPEGITPVSLQMPTPTRHPSTSRTTGPSPGVNRSGSRPPSQVLR